MAMWRPAMAAAGKNSQAACRKWHSRAGLARLCGTALGLSGRRVGHRRRRQAGKGMARNRVRARLNWVSQGQRWGRCKVRHRAARVRRPAREKKRRRKVLVVTTCSPRPKSSDGLLVDGIHGGGFRIQPNGFDYLLPSLSSRNFLYKRTSLHSLHLWHTISIST